MTLLTEEEISIAIKVMAHSKIVRKWCDGEMRAHGIDPDSPEGKRFYYKERINAAKRFVK
jgi:hypothetical protein